MANYRRNYFTLAIFMITLFVSATLLEGATIGRRISHKRFVIHVPLKIKSHHHTHTVFTHIHHNGGKVEYKILGYSNLDHGHSYGPESDSHIVEDSVHHLSDGQDSVAPHGGDIIFNHFSRAHPPINGELIASDHDGDWH